MTTPLAEQITLAITDPAAFTPRGAGETEAGWSARAVIALLADALAVRPCHITGMHEPDHHTRYQCTDQKAVTLDALLAALGLEFADLPRRLHDETCGWCHQVPTQEKYRQRLRSTYQWAGAEIPPALAGPAPDAPRPGDADALLGHLTSEWRQWPAVFTEVQAASGWPAERIAAAFGALRDSGAAEAHEHGRGVRRRAAAPSPAHGARGTGPGRALLTGELG